MSEPAGLIGAMRLVVRRELTLAWRRWDEVTQPLIFYLVVTTLFPLATTPELAVLRTVGGGVVWVAALLSSLLALESVFRSDVEDGTMEQWVLSGQPLAWLLLAKVVAHWLMTGLPLVLVSPVSGRGAGVARVRVARPRDVARARHRDVERAGRYRRGADGRGASWQRAAVLAGAASGDAAADLRCTGRGTVARRAIGGRAAAAARGDVLSGAGASVRSQCRRR